MLKEGEAVLKTVSMATRPMFPESDRTGDFHPVKCCYVPSKVRP